MEKKQKKAIPVTAMYDKMSKTELIILLVQANHVIDSLTRLQQHNNNPIMGGPYSRIDRDDDFDFSVFIGK